MIFSTAGSHLKIGGVRPQWEGALIDASFFADETWTEVDGATSLGSISGEWITEKVTNPTPDDPDAPILPQFIKAERPTKTMQIAVDFNAADTGQIKMLQAEQDVSPYAFCIVFPDTSQRMFVALVIGAADIMDEANNTVGLVFSLILQSNVVRQMPA